MTLEKLKSLVGSGTAIHLTSPEQIKDFCKMAREIGFEMISDGGEKAENVIGINWYVWLEDAKYDGWCQHNLPYGATHNGGKSVEFSEPKEEPKPQFEVGEMVHGSENRFVGKYEIISRQFKGDSWFYDVKAVESSFGVTDYIYENQDETLFEHIKEEPQPLTPKYKVGEKVAFVDGGVEYEIDKVSICYRLKDFYSFIPESQFKLLPKAKKVFSFIKWISLMTERRDFSGVSALYDHYDTVKKCDGKTEEEINALGIKAPLENCFIEVEVK